MKQLIVIPTYNEKPNITILIKKLIKLYKSKFQILIIDDNSPDCTSAEVLKLKKKYKFIKLKSREKKLGIGSAHKYGIRYAIKNNFKILITMDADGTHNPKYIKKFLSLIKKYDLITTTRFSNKRSLKSWPLASTPLPVLILTCATILDASLRESSAVQRLLGRLSLTLAISASFLA